MTVSGVIDYAEDLGYNVLGAINTDFFSSKKVPLGVVVEDGIYKCSPEGRTVISFDGSGKARISENVSVQITLTNEGGAPEHSNSGKSVSLTHLNKYRVDSGGMYLFSEYFSTVSTRTSTDGWMVRFKVLDGSDISVSGELELEVIELIEGSEPQKIGKDNLILTAAAASGLGEHFKKFAVGDRVKLTTTCSSSSLESADWATGGGDVLISDGKITSSDDWDSSIMASSPRTALGITANGSIIYYVVDGRTSGHSTGVSLSGLAEQMLAEGCVYAVNFDGGGSSAMSVRIPGSRYCKTVNLPSDGSERSCSTYILLVTDTHSDGKARRLHIKNDSDPILSGSTIKLEYAATDSGYMPVSVPVDIIASSSGLGSISNGYYTAGNTAGQDTVSLSSASSGLRGSGTLNIITSLTSIEVSNNATGRTIDELSMEAGETISLSAQGFYHKQPVLINDSMFSFSVTGSIGTITSDGRFTASDVPGAVGTINITAGNITKQISVTLPKYFTDTVGIWSEDYINSLYEDGIVSGITETEYWPNANIRRGDFILMLYRAAGKPSVRYTKGFSDVTPDKYYYDAVSWAAENGIASGTGNGKFGPSDPLTRQQAFTFVYRALSKLGISYSNGLTSSLSAFSDASAVSEYAKLPTATLIKLGVVSGSGGKLNPNSELTRGEMAKILWCTLELK